MNNENINIVALLASDNFIVINRGMLKRYGLNVTLMLCELASEYNYYNKEEKLEEDGLFFSTIENISDKTGLSRYQQAEALKTLDEMGIVKTIVKGIPAKRYFKLDVEKLAKQIVSNSPSSLQKTDKLDVKKLATNNNNIKIIIKNNNQNKIEGQGDKENKNKKENQEMEHVYKHYLDQFGTTAGRYKLTDKRKAKLKSRLQDCGADMICDAIDHARADYFYNGDNDRGWKADLDFILRSYENVEKLANLTPRQRKLTWQEKKEQEEQAEFDRKFGEPKYVYEPCNLPEGYEVLGGNSAPDEPTREPFSEDFIEQMRQRAFGGKNKKEVKNDN